jgi:diguanylate cyclase (GGDEF)-like protein
MVSMFAASRVEGPRERELRSRRIGGGLLLGAAIQGVVASQVVGTEVAPWLAVAPMALAGMLTTPLHLVGAASVLLVGSALGSDASVSSRVAAMVTTLGAAVCAYRLASVRRGAAASSGADGHAWVQAARSPSAVSEDDDARMMRDASRTVRESLDRTLTLLRAGLRGRTAVVIWLDSRHRTARVRAAETSVAGLVTEAFNEREGLLGLMHADETPRMLSGVDAAGSFLPWYEHAPGPSHVIGAPIRHEGLLLGFLVVDRDASFRPYDDVDALAVATAATDIVSTLHTERLLVDAAHSRRETALLYEAAEALNNALTPDEVCATAQRLLRRIATIDAVVICRFDQDSGTQRVIFADGDCRHLIDHEFDDDMSVAALSLRRQHVLPYNGRIESADLPVFGRNVSLERHRSLLVFPLEMGHRPVGTAAIASASEDAFDVTVRDRARLIVNYVAAALSNALAYSNMVHRATTDGMTGLLNHRTYKERGAEALARVQRSGRALCVIMCDIDHFKKVNDTYGHATGDDVIRGVAGVLKNSLRRIDLGARYGGEEFAVLLEDADIDAAAALAERLRQAVGALSFDSSGRTLKVTLSLGVAERRGDESLATLIERADAALYSAKRSGRDRVVADRHRVTSASRG